MNAQPGTSLILFNADPMLFPKGDVPSLLRRYLRPGQTAVDIGAHTGELTAVMADCVGDSGTVYAFEPTALKDTQFWKQIAHTTHRPRIVHEHLALGETAGTVPMFRAWTANASRWHGDEGEPVNVPMVTLDSYFPVEHPVDLVKIDAQGSESHILLGAENLLRRCPLWILELWPWGLQTAGRDCVLLLDQLRDAGLTPRWMNGAIIDSMGIQCYLAAVAGRDHKHANIYATR